MSVEWPDKMKDPTCEETIGNNNFPCGWNACHDAFMKVIESLQQSPTVNDLMSIEIEVTNNDFLTEESAQRLVDIHKCFLHWKDIEAKISGGYFGTHCHICHDSVDICRCVKTQPALVPLDESNLMDFMVRWDKSEYPNDYIKDPEQSEFNMRKANKDIVKVICSTFGQVPKEKEIHKCYIQDCHGDVVTKQGEDWSCENHVRFGQVPQRDEVTVEDIKRIIDTLPGDQSNISIAQAIHDRIYGGKDAK